MNMRLNLELNGDSNDAQGHKSQQSSSNINEHAFEPWTGAQMRLAYNKGIQIINEHEFEP